MQISRSIVQQLRVQHFARAWGRRGVWTVWTLDWELYCGQWEEVRFWNVRHGVDCSVGDNMGYKRRLGFGTFLTVLIVLAAIYYRNTDDVLQKRLLTLLHGLEKLENKYVITRRPKVAIGYGVCTDVFIDAKHLLRYSDEVGRPEHFDEINTELELLKSFAYYFRHGAAAE